MWLDRQIAGLAPSTGIAAIAGTMRQLAASMARTVSREHTLSLVDQAVVSGANFLTTLAIARWSGPDQLGLYAIGLSFLISLLAFQDALILQPYSIQRLNSLESPTERAGASLVVSFLFAAASVVVLAGGALAIGLGVGNKDLALLVWAIAAIIPFALMRDFARRFCFARLEFGSALLIDIAAAAVQLSILVWLAATGRMTALGAAAGLGAASVLTMAAWWYHAGTSFTIRLGHAWHAIRQTWTLGKWLLVGRVTGQAQGYITYWIAMAVAGAAVTGVFAACMSIVSVANPLLIGLGNVLMPKSVLAWKNDGGAGLWREAVRNAVLIAAVMAPISLAIAFEGDFLLRVLYHGAEFAGHGSTLAVLSAAALATALGLPASNALAAMERPGAIVKITVLVALPTAALVWLLMECYGLSGAVYGVLAGNLASLIARWLAFYRRVTQSRDAAALDSGLREFCQFSGRSRWKVSRLGEGLHAEAFKISPADSPSWRNHRELVAKVYRPTATLEMARAEFNALLELHTALNGREFAGWRISVAQPLYVCQSQPALILTAISGQHIDAYASSNQRVTSQTLCEAARALAAAMQQFWSTGRVHGDFGVGNVLFDMAAREISIIDPGTPKSSSACADRAGPISPAAFDLANMLYWDVATDFADLTGGSTAHVDRQVLFENLLQAVIETIDCSPDKQLLLDEILNCFQRDIARYLRPSWSVTGVWKRLLRTIALRRACSILQRTGWQSAIRPRQPSVAASPALLNQP